MKNKLKPVRRGSKAASASQTKTDQSKAVALPRNLPVDLEERYVAKEFKVVALRDWPIPTDLVTINTPELASKYWRLNVVSNPYFNSECECTVVLILNSHHRVKGHQFVSIGTLDTALVHAREVFRTAIVASAAAIVLMHNHPSGELTPSYADIKTTHNLIRAGKVLNIELLDHVIVGDPRQDRFYSLFGHGYFKAIDSFEGVNRKITKREVETILRRMCRIFNGHARDDRRRTARPGRRPALT